MSFAWNVWDPSFDAAETIVSDLTKRFKITGRPVLGKHVLERIAQFTPHKIPVASGDTIAWRETMLISSARYISSLTDGTLDAMIKNTKEIEDDERRDVMFHILADLALRYNRKEAIEKLVQVYVVLPDGTKHFVVPQPIRNSALIWAAAHDDVELMMYLRGFPVMLQGKSTTPLPPELYAPFVQIVDDDQTDNALIVASENGSMQVLQFLMGYSPLEERLRAERPEDVPVHQPFLELGLPLIAAAKHGQLEAVMYFVHDFGEDPHFLEDDALRQAIRYRHFNVVEYLLRENPHDENALSDEQVSNVNGIDDEGNDMLWYAVHSGDLRMVVYILQKSRQTPFGSTEFFQESVQKAFEEAASLGYVNIFDEKPPIMEYLAGGLPEGITEEEQLSKDERAQPDPLGETYDEDTPPSKSLMNAITGDHLDAVIYLTKYLGVRVEREDNVYLDTAVVNGNVDIVKYLVGDLPEWLDTDFRLQDHAEPDEMTLRNAIDNEQASIVRYLVLRPDGGQRVTLSKGIEQLFRFVTRQELRASRGGAAAP